MGLKASSLFSLKYPGHDPRVCGFLLLDGGGGCGEGGGYRAGAGPGFRFFLFRLQIIMEIKILNSTKTKGP